MDKKLLQLVLDDIPPIRFPMSAGYMAQKTMLIGWSGDAANGEWVKLNDIIGFRVARTL